MGGGYARSSLGSAAADQIACCNTATCRAPSVLQERKFRKRVDADGGVGGVRDARLSEFLDASLRSQQAVRRAIRGAS